jgi:hypothetical protein
VGPGGGGADTSLGQQHAADGAEPEGDDSGSDSDVQREWHCCGTGGADCGKIVRKCSEFLLLGTEEMQQLDADWNCRIWGRCFECSGYQSRSKFATAAGCLTIALLKAARWIVPRRVRWNSD